MAANLGGVLSHPEILSVEKLKYILSSRGIPGKDLIDKDKNGLVQLFYRFIVPLPQRTSHMRRSNRLKKNMTVVNTSDGRGLKRKNFSSEMAQTSQRKEAPNILHDMTISPTSACTNKIRNLNMNLQVSKPLKLNRECLLHEYKQNKFITKSNILNSTRQSEVSETEKHECSKISNKNNSQSEEEKQNMPKKFKRITVTWP